MVLSYQQNKCLGYLTQGMTYQEIGDAMHLSPRTVEYYINIIRNKTGLTKRSRLVQWFNRNNKI